MSTATPEAVSELENLFGPVIHAYTRAQAIEDGVLVAVPQEVSTEAGFRIPVAMTREVWEDCVVWTDEDEKGKRQFTGQDQDGRLWDVLSMGRLAARRARSGGRAPYRIVRIPRPGHGAARNVQLVIGISGGDDGAPVITIMQPGQD